MGREQAALAKVAPKEKARLLRIRSHDKAVRWQTVSSVVFSSAVQRDAPAGHAMLQEVISDPQSPAAKTLMKVKGWRELKFVFPETARGDYVLYARWREELGEFSASEGGTSYYWRKDFRTVHLG